MKNIIFILTLFLFSISFGQSNDVQQVVVTPNAFYSKPLKINADDSKIDGSPYINGDKFNKVIIDGYSKNVQDLRYNAYEDEMEFKTGNGLFYANKENNLNIQFPALSKTYKCLDYTYEGKSKLGYLVMLVDNLKHSLYKRERVELLKGEKSTNAYSKDANDYYAKDKDQYLISRGSNQLFRFPKNANDASGFFGIDKNTLESFVKTNKINFNKEQDIIKLVEFVNQQ